ncbi:MAG: transposase [Steroidobacteraceae bacterium]|nr:transposase [Steroidobacteraceae bacterium]
MARPKGSAEVIEARRRQALRLLDQGYSLGEVGRMLGCAPSSVMRWRDARTQGGKQALKVRPTPGRPPQLKARDRQRIVGRLLKGAMANGFATELWTTARVAQVIHKCCGIGYHKSHVARLLHELGFSCQKPERRALERDEARIEQWKRKDWPRVKKTLRGWVPTSSLSTNPASC